MSLLFADVMVLNDIIEQAAGRHSRASDRGGKANHIDTKNGFILGLVFECFSCVYFIILRIYFYTISE